MKRLFIALLAIVSINYFYPDLFAPVKNFMEDVKISISGLTAYPIKKEPPKWVSVPKVFSFTDLAGQTHTFNEDRNKPLVIAVWIEKCGYSHLAMTVLNAIRQAYPTEQLDVIAFFGNRRSGEEILTMARQEGYDTVTLAGLQTVEQIAVWRKAAQEALHKAKARPGATKRDIEQAVREAAEPFAPPIVALNDGLRIRGPGRDIYIIDSKGFIQTVSTVDENDGKLPGTKIFSRVQNKLQRTFRTS